MNTITASITDFIPWFPQMGFGAHFFIGLLFLFVGQAWLIFAAYSEDVRTGQWVVFVPGFAFIFIAEHPKKGLPPLILQLIGAGILFSTFFSLVPFGPGGGR
jgi:hypothetical protein